MSEEKRRFKNNILIQKPQSIESVGFFRFKNRIRCPSIQKLLLCTYDKGTSADCPN